MLNQKKIILFFFIISSLVQMFAYPDKIFHAKHYAPYNRKSFSKKKRKPPIIAHKNENFLTEPSNMVFLYVNKLKDFIEAQGFIKMLSTLHPSINLYLLTENAETKRIAGYFMDPYMIKLINPKNISTYLHAFHSILPQAIIAIRKALNINLLLATKIHSIPITWICQYGKINPLDNQETSSIINKIYEKVSHIYCEKKDFYKKIKQQYKSEKKALYTGSIRLCNLMNNLKEYKECLGITNIKNPFKFPTVVVDTDNIVFLENFLTIFKELQKNNKDLKLIIEPRFDDVSLIEVENLLKKLNYQYFNWNYINTTKITSNASDMNDFFVKLNFILSKVDIILNSVMFTRLFWKFLSNIYVIDSNLLEESLDDLYEADACKTQCIIIGKLAQNHSLYPISNNNSKTKKLLTKILENKKTYKTNLEDRYKQTLKKINKTTLKYKRNLKPLTPFNIN